MAIQRLTYQSLPRDKRALIGRAKILELIRSASLIGAEELDRRILRIRKWVSGEL